MRILLDENLPASLLKALRQLGHEVDSVNSLRLKGLDNSTLYQQVAQGYSLCFTKDAGFAHNVRHIKGPPKVKLLRVTLPQQPARPFVKAFIDAFRRTNWSHYQHGDDWP